MIRVEIGVEQGNIAWFSVSGHAGFAEVGFDVVCAAVSALVLNAVNSCEHLLHVSLVVRDEPNFLHCTVPGGDCPKGVQLLLRSMRYGLEQTAQEWPDYVRMATVGE